MKINCTDCGYEVRLDHEVFNDYQGPIKCFCCGTIMDIRITTGILDCVTSQVIPQELPGDLLADQNRDLEASSTYPKDNTL